MVNDVSAAYINADRRMERHVGLFVVYNVYGLSPCCFSGADREGMTGSSPCRKQRLCPIRYEKAYSVTLPSVSNSRQMGNHLGRAKKAVNAPVRNPLAQINDIPHAHLGKGTKAQKGCNRTALEKYNLYDRLLRLAPTDTSATSGNPSDGTSSTVASASTGFSLSLLHRCDYMFTADTKNVRNNRGHAVSNEFPVVAPIGRRPWPLTRSSSSSSGKG